MLPEEGGKDCLLPRALWWLVTVLSWVSPVGGQGMRSTTGSARGRDRITMLAPGRVGLPVGVRRNGVASAVFLRAMVLNAWLFMRLHVDLLRLASAMCRAS